MRKRLRAFWPQKRASNIHSAGLAANEGREAGKRKRAWPSHVSQPFSVCVGSASTFWNQRPVVSGPWSHEGAPGGACAENAGVSQVIAG